MMDDTLYMIVAIIMISFFVSAFYMAQESRIDNRTAAVSSDTYQNGLKIGGSLHLMAKDGKFGVIDENEIDTSQYGGCNPNIPIYEDSGVITYAHDGQKIDIGDSCDDELNEAVVFTAIHIENGGTEKPIAVEVGDR